MTLQHRSLIVVARSDPRPGNSKGQRGGPGFQYLSQIALFERWAELAMPDWYISMTHDLFWTEGMYTTETVYIMLLLKLDHVC